MRVIAGTARGRRLASPPGDRVRPTLDRVREALFNILAPEIDGATFLDLFAGSGANGIEALSRGAAEVLFVDNHPQSLACIRKNLEDTRLIERGTVVNRRLPGEIHRLQGPWDIVFADPPYDFDDYPGLLAALGGGGLVAPGGRVIVEHTRKITLPEAAGALTLTRQRPYGMTTLSFYA